MISNSEGRKAGWSGGGDGWGGGLEKRTARRKRGVKERERRKKGKKEPSSWTAM